MRTTAGAVNTDIGFFFFPLTLFLFSLSLLIHPAVVAAIAFSRVNDARGRADRFVFFFVFIFLPPGLLEARGGRGRVPLVNSRRVWDETSRKVEATRSRRYRGRKINRHYSRTKVSVLDETLD